MYQVLATLNFKEIYEYLVYLDEREWCATKKCILAKFNLEPTKSNFRLVTKAMAEMKKQGMVYTAYSMNEDGEFGGRGYSPIYKIEESTTADSVKEGE